MARFKTTYPPPAPPACTCVLCALPAIADTIEAFSRGEIELERVDLETPQEIHILGPGTAYTVTTIAKHLGFTQRDGHGGVEPTKACRLAFKAYHELWFGDAS